MGTNVPEVRTAMRDPYEDRTGTSLLDEEVGLVLGLIVLVGACA
jgi:hypothetical protein